MPEEKFTFKHTVETVGEDGKAKKQTKTYSLPPYGDSAGKVPGWVVQELLLEPSNRAAEVALQVHALKASAASDEAKKALGEMPAEEMMEVLGRWMGESVRSSS